MTEEQRKRLEELAKECPCDHFNQGCSCFMAGAEAAWELANQGTAYSQDELRERVKYLNEHGPLVYSVQYNRHYILNQRNEIVLSLGRLLKSKEDT